MAYGHHHTLASKAPPVLVSLLGVIHESVEELVSVLLLELLAQGLQSLDGLLMLLPTLAQVLLSELQEALAVDGPAEWYALHQSCTLVNQRLLCFQIWLAFDATSCNASV